MIAAAAAARQRRIQHVYDAFRVAGATAAERACSLEALGLAEGGDVHELERAGVLRRARGGDAWYLDEAAYIVRRDTRGSRSVRLVLVAVIAVVALVLGVLIALLNARHRGI